MNLIEWGSEFTVCLLIAGHPDNENQSGGRTETIDSNIFKSSQSNVRYVNSIFYLHIYEILALILVVLLLSMYKAYKFLFLVGPLLIAVLLIELTELP